MKIILGLGNIGNTYDHTRHNAGFIALGEFVKILEKESSAPLIPKDSPKLHAITAKTTWKDAEILIAKPTTLMNRSGLAAAALLNFYKETPQNLIVLYDDIDLPLGTIRSREEGSAGTHNGMKSLIEALGTEKFPRIRIGIESRGELAPKEQDLSSFVLSRFTEQELPLLAQGIAKAIQALDELITTTKT